MKGFGWAADDAPPPCRVEALLGNAMADGGAGARGGSCTRGGAALPGPAPPSRAAE